MTHGPNFLADVAARDLAAGRHSEPLAPPLADTFEVTVIGIGTGESIVLHLGNNEWMIVDTFRTGGRGGQSAEPAPIQYLRAIGVDPATAVQAIVVTHPHHDHYDGIEDVLAACASADGPPPLWVANPSVWGGRWDLLLDHMRHDAEERINRKKISQLSNVFASADVEATLRFLDAGKPIETLPDVSALSPLERTESDGVLDIAKVARNPNLTSVVLWVDCGGARVLLGADMEIDPRYGWPAIADRFPTSFASRLTRRAKPLDRAAVVKVPHHGSDGSHLPRVYEHFADNKARMLITRNLNPRGRRTGGTGGLPDAGAVSWMIDNGFDTFVLGSRLGANEAPPTLRLGWITLRRTVGRGEWVPAVYGQVDGPVPDVPVEP